MAIESRIVDPYVENYIKTLVPKHTGLLQELEVYAARFQVPIVQSEVAQYLKVLFKMTQPKSVLEIGTAIGYSASLFACEMASGNIDTIELNEGMAEIATQTFQKLSAIMPNVNVQQWLGDAQVVIPKLENKYDLIFIDAAKGHYQAFLDLCLPRLKDGGIIVSDNVLYKGMVATDAYLVRRKITIVKRMRKYLAFISNHPDLETTILPIGDGVAITYKKGGTA